MFELTREDIKRICTNKKNQDALLVAIRQYAYTAPKSYIKKRK
tara:strand:- start:187 stop:315 length:129 start_codon:yes stop_codon:yes gene_type:complete